jgi:amino acid transporter
MATRAVCEPSGREQTGSCHPDLECRQTVHGAKPGDWFVRVTMYKGFTRVGRGHLVPRASTGQPTTRLGQAAQRLKRLLVGRPVPTVHESHERLGKVKGLVVLSSDALSSVTYATEEIMKILVLAGALSLTLGISAAIVLLLAIVVVSYRQTIRAYPSGGGSYIVASDNLGILPGVTAAAALLIDYVLTVSVSVAAGIANLISLLPELLPEVVPLCVAAVLLLTLANLRGLRESGTIFAVPTYLFVATVYVLIGWGAFRLASGGLAYMPPASARAPGAEAVGAFLVLRAFAQGCTALTGTEAISNGVPAFKSPEARNARATLVWMGLLLGTMFLGLSFLAVRIGVQPAGAEATVLSQIGLTVFEGGPLWVLLQVTAALILVLAANTSFADFPRLASILARDGFLPRMFQFRGDRLAFTTGVLCLALLANLLLVGFAGNLDALVPLYAVGVFASFTLSQTGMVVHWRRVREPGWQRAAVLNGLGAVATGLVTGVIAVAKFAEGAWLVVMLIPLLIGMFWGIHQHYGRLERLRGAQAPLVLDQVVVRVAVPIADLGVEARRALAFARAIAPDERHVVAVHVADDAAAAERLRRQWEEWGPGLELVLIESPFRSLTRPLLAYLEALGKIHPNDTLTVVLPEFVPSHWWEHLLHNQTALRLKAVLLFQPGLVVTSVPWHVALSPGR